MDERAISANSSNVAFAPRLEEMTSTSLCSWLRVNRCHFLRARDLTLRTVPLNAQPGNGDEIPEELRSYCFGDARSQLGLAVQRCYQPM